MLAACAACSAPAPNGATPTATAPSAELTIETVAEECERLIATINGGRALVEETSKQAEAAGADELEARARAHESVARGAGEVPFRTPISSASQASTSGSRSGKRPCCAT